MSHLRQMRLTRLTRLSQLMVALVLVCGSLAGFALGQALAHDSSAAALPLQDQRASVTARTGPSSSTSATSSAASGGHSGGGSQPGATSGSQSGSAAHAGGNHGSAPLPGKQHAKGNSKGHGHGHHGKPGQDDGPGAGVAPQSNGQTITVSGDGSSVTIASNGSGTSVSVTSGTSGGNQQGSAGSGNANLSCSGTQLRGSWPAIAEPLRVNEALIVRDGSALPVRFQLQGACAGQGIVRARLYLAPVNGDFIPAVPANASNQGNTFRFDTHSGQYVYMLTTRGLPPGMYQLGIDLGNGHLFVVPFTLR